MTTQNTLHHASHPFPNHYGLNTSHSCSELSTTKALHVSLDDNPNLMVYLKMENIIERMQKDESGVPIRTVKSFMTKIPSVFTGQDLIQWLINSLDLSDTTESLILANRMAAYGYFFPIDDHVLAVKNDNTYYRFQTPYYWPSKSWAPENTDYAVYLCKRTMQNKARLELADYEAENLARLQKMFSRKWEYIFMQAEAQSKVDKKRDKQERKILDTQERAFWDVYRPPPGCVNTTELDIKKVCRMNKYSTNNRTDNLRDLAALKRQLLAEATNLRSRIDKCTIRVSKCAETYVEYFNLHREYDAFLVATEPSNPWISDSTELWEMFEKCSREQVAERRIRRWAFSCWEMLKDPVGHDHFKAFLEKEYATENLLFVEAVWKMKKQSQKDVAEECQRIWKQFLGPGAEMLVNVDSKTHKVTDQNMNDPDRWTFDDAAAHLYYLMTSDSYSRYLRSSHYKDFLEGAKKKNTRTFALPKLSGAKLAITNSSS
eukprot:maker-scaffold55_size446313-snap-gene-1.14 protein:Tk00221 transcript:maker-scaffold55_size446313-snap-gene-1.14-mRNA-1 annotation:"regulator of g-protein signaling 7 isoform x1"